MKLKLIFIGANTDTFVANNGDTVEYWKAEMRTNNGTVNFSCTKEVYEKLVALDFGKEVECTLKFSQAGKAKITEVK